MIPIVLSSVKRKPSKMTNGFLFLESTHHIPGNKAFIMMYSSRYLQTIIAPMLTPTPTCSNLHDQNHCSFQPMLSYSLPPQRH